jgi:hypothetical protein
MWLLEAMIWSLQMEELSMTFMSHNIPETILIGLPLLVGQTLVQMLYWEFFYNSKG